MLTSSFSPVLLIAIAFINWAVAVLVLFAGYKKSVNIFFSIAAFFLGGWVFGVAAFILSDSMSASMFWAKLYYFCPISVALWLMLFVRSFPTNDRKSYVVDIISVLAYLSVAVPLVAFKNFITLGIVYHDWGKEVILDKSDYLIYTLYFVFTVIYLLIYISRKRKSLRGLYRAQSNFFFYGTLLAAIFGTYFNLVLPWLGNYREIWAGPLFTSILAVMIGYSIVRHRMFDVRLFVARFIAYTLTLSSLTLGYAALSFVIIEKIAPVESDVIASRLVSISFLLIATIAFAPLKSFFRRVSNSVFYRDSYEPQVFLDEINNYLVGKLGTKDVVKDVPEIIDTYIKSSFSKIIIYNKRSNPKIESEELSKKEIDEILGNEKRFSYAVTEQLEDQNQKFYNRLVKHKIAYLSKLTNQEEEIGALLIGDKKSGGLLNKQDVRVLNIISNELTIAVQNSMRFEEISKFNQTLQQKVEDATKELRRSNEKLKALDQAKDDFISMASHQLRTPLTTMKGYVSMVLEGDAGPVNDKQRELLDQAFTSSQRMVYLIADLLNVSRLRTGKFVIESTPTYLPDIVEGELNQLVETAKQRQVEINYDKPAKFPTVQLDETKVRQVIMNFVDNAIYYTPPGGHITVELHDMPNSVELTVTDDGIGVPKAEQHHLFTKFYRAGNARKARPDGTGLGLFMAKKVIISQGGALIFRSQEGKGSTFGFTFPKDKIAAKLAAAKQR